MINFWCHFRCAQSNINQIRTQFWRTEKLNVKRIRIIKQKQKKAQATGTARIESTETHAANINHIKFTQARIWCSAM